MISIIIITYNEEKYLPKLLKSIKGQTYKNYEIIVADANSEDSTKKIARNYGCKVVKGGIPGVGRNKGAQAAKGKFLLFLDADTLLDKRFLKNCVEQFEWQGLGALTCYLKPKESGVIYKLICNCGNMVLFLSQFLRPYASGCAIMTTKKMHNAVGGFVEKPVLYEDHRYIRSISKIKKVRMLKNCKVTISMRRFKAKGIFNALKPQLITEVRLLMNKDVKFKDMDYEFGNFR